MDVAKDVPARYRSRARVLDLLPEPILLLMAQNKIGWWQVSAEDVDSNLKVTFIYKNFSQFRRI